MAQVATTDAAVHTALTAGNKAEALMLMTNFTVTAGDRGPVPSKHPSPSFLPPHPLYRARSLKTPSPSFLPPHPLCRALSSPHHRPDRARYSHSHTHMSCPLHPRASAIPHLRSCAHQRPLTALVEWRSLWSDLFVKYRDGFTNKVPPKQKCENGNKVNCTFRWIPDSDETGYTDAW